jgi:hypothetical protein
MKAGEGRRSGHEESFSGIDGETSRENYFAARAAAASLNHGVLHHSHYAVDFSTLDTPPGFVYKCKRNTHRQAVLRELNNQSGSVL